MEVTQKLKFLIPVIDNFGVTHKIVFEQPSKLTIEAIRPLLSTIYSKAKSGIHPDILVVDYESYIAESGIAEATARSFLEKCFLGAKDFNEKTLEMLDFTPFSDLEVQSNLEGMTLFILALFRYGGVEAKQGILREFNTSLGYLELRDYLAKLQGDITTSQSEVKES